MKANHSLTARSSFHLKSIGSVKKATDKMPLALSRPAGLSNAPTEVEIPLTRWTGLQPSSAALLIAAQQILAS